MTAHAATAPRVICVRQGIIQEGIAALGERIGATDRGVLSGRRRTVGRRKRILAAGDAFAAVDFFGRGVALPVLQKRVGVAIGEEGLLLHSASVHGGTEVRHRNGRRGIGIGVRRVQVYQLGACVRWQNSGGGRRDSRGCHRRRLTVGARHDS